ncbi:MAG: DUF4397 domain-containing protein [Polyangiaceae bacterium]
MRTRLIWLFVPLSILAACSDDETGDSASPSSSSSGTGAASSGGAGGTGGNTSSTGGNDVGGGGSGGSGGAATGAARVAHLSPDAPPVDFCVSPDAGGSWVGPVMAKLLADDDGLQYTEVTGYLELPAATYSVRLVAPASADCDTALGGLPDVPGIVVEADTDYTLAATGMLTPEGDDDAFALRAYGDDNTVGAGKQLRFIHASPGTPNVDVDLNSGGSSFPSSPMSPTAPSVPWLAWIPDQRPPRGRHGERARHGHHRRRAGARGRRATRRRRGDRVRHRQPGRDRRPAGASAWTTARRLTT